MNTFKPQYSELKHLAILNIELYAITDTYLCELKKIRKLIKTYSTIYLNLLLIKIMVIF